VLERLLGGPDLRAFQLRYRIGLTAPALLGREGRLFDTRRAVRAGDVLLPDLFVPTGSDRLQGGAQGRPHHKHSLGEAL